MSNSDEVSRLDFIAGQMHELLSFALAVINTHQDPANLEAHLASADLAASAHAGAEQASDSFLAGMEDVAVRLRSAAETARQRKGEPRAAAH